ncbi:hypothetical protein BTVI_108909 [Pitangus sulphuratus]|nr:hypothetical protein BTVI_108909 [Pitangus sulphuratus]
MWRRKHRPVQPANKMAAPMELRCWGGDWGLPSVHPESLTVMAYAKFSGAPLTVNTISSSWKAPKDVMSKGVTELWLFLSENHLDKTILSPRDGLVGKTTTVLN